MIKQTLVSIIIPVKNAASTIIDCLDSIKKQTYKNIEVIIVDNFSTDNTKKNVLRFKKKNAALRFSFYEKGPERSAQRNFGAKKAKGQYYFYVDSDMILSPKVVEECVNKFENRKKNKKLCGLYIPEIVLGNNFWSKVRCFERSFYNATVVDCVRFVPLKIFNDVGGFDMTLTGPEDWDFDKKIRRQGQVDIIKSPLYHDESNFSLKNYLNKKNFYIFSIKRYINKWGKDDPDTKKQLGVYYRFIGVYVEKQKWRKLIRHPILTLCMYFLRFMIGLQYFLFIQSLNKES